MGRDADRGRKNVPADITSTREGTEKRESPKDDRKSKRGWSDVFDNLTYSGGPGDNIYVFG
jgi:hypothetical protein